MLLEFRQINTMARDDGKEHRNCSMKEHNVVGVIRRYMKSCSRYSSQKAGEKS